MYNGDAENGESDDAIIAKDSKLHPGCNYSKSYKKSCTSTSQNGLICESVRNIYRVCQNKAPALILNSKSTNNSSKGQEETESLPQFFDFLTELQKGINDPHNADLGSLLEKYQDSLNKYSVMKPPIRREPFQPNKPKKKWSIRDFERDDDDDGIERA